MRGLADMYKYGDFPVKSAVLGGDDVTKILKLLHNSNWSITWFQLHLPGLETGRIGGTDGKILFFLALIVSPIPEQVASSAFTTSSRTS